MILSVFILYLIVLMWIGLYFTRHNRDLSDFVLGGRRLGPWVTAISAQASDMSGWLLIGLPAAAYAAGFSILWVVVGLLAGIVFNWLVVAPRLRRQSEESGALTIPDVLESSAGSRFPSVRVVAVAIILLFYASYIAAQFIAAGKIFETVFTELDSPWGMISLSYHQGIVIGAVVILIYTTAGGFLAVSYTDLVQGLLMVFALVVLPIIGLVQLGGLPELFQAMQVEVATSLTLTAGKTGFGFLMGIAVGGMSWGLGYPGQPHILVRFMAIQDPSKLKMSALISIVWSVLALYGGMMIGFVGLARYGAGMPDPDQLFPLMATANLPGWLAGVLIAAAVAAMMSTVDSQLLVAISAVVEDIYVKLFKRNQKGRGALLLSRLVSLVLGLAGMMIAWERTDVFGQVFNAWGGLAAGLGPAVLLALLWKRVTAAGLTMGMIVGTVMIHVWPNDLALAFLANLLLIWGVSSAVKKK